MRRHYDIPRLHILSHQKRFVPVLLAVVGLNPGITETDLMGVMRGSWNAFYTGLIPGGRHFSFGPYDFRSAVAAMVNEGVLLEHRTPRSSSYALNETKAPLDKLLAYIKETYGG